jgi:hypothetical protein
MHHGPFRFPGWEEAKPIAEAQMARINPIEQSPKIKPLNLVTQVNA